MTLTCIPKESRFCGENPLIWQKLSPGFSLLASMLVLRNWSSNVVHSTGWSESHSRPAGTLTLVQSRSSKVAQSLWIHGQITVDFHLLCMCMQLCIYPRKIASWGEFLNLSSLPYNMFWAKLWQGFSISEIYFGTLRMMFSVQSSFIKEKKEESVSISVD